MYHIINNGICENQGYLVDDSNTILLTFLISLKSYVRKVLKFESFFGLLSICVTEVLT